VLWVGPGVGNGVLDQLESYPAAVGDDCPQALLVHNEVAHLTDVALREHPPDLVAAVVADGRLAEGLLHEIVAVVAPQCLGQSLVHVVALECHGGGGSGWSAVAVVVKQDG